MTTNNTTVSLFVGGLTFDMSHDAIMNTLLTIGEVSDLSIIMDKKTGCSRGYGFFTISNPKSAKTFLVASLSLNNHKLIVKEAFKSSGESNTQNRIFFKASPVLHTEEEVQVAVALFGTPTLIHLYKDFNGGSKAYGFVEFKTLDQCSEAIKRKKHFYAEN